MLKLEIDIDQLIEWGIFWLLIITMVYMFFDVNYFLRMFFTMYWAKLFQNKLKLHETGIIYGFCLTNDADMFMPIMSNARYVRELDFARLNFCERTGIRPAISKVINGTVLQSVNLASYKKKIPLFTFYKITTQLSYWDEKVLYLEHHFVSLNLQRMYATVFSKLNVIGLNIHEIICDLSGKDPLEKPLKSIKIEQFCETIDASRSKLQNKYK